MIEEYEISRNVGLGIAVAGIGGVAGLGGRTRACGWIGADGSHHSRILEADRHLFRTLQPQGCGKVATITISGDFRLDAGLGRGSASECDC